MYAHTDTHKINISRKFCRSWRKQVSPRRVNPATVID